MKNAQEIVKSFWDALNERQREVLASRFGLGKSGGQETLAAIGERYHITRERVRQIETAALKIVRRKIDENKDAQELLDKCKKYLKKNGGVVAQEAMLNYVRSQASDITKNHLDILLAASNAFEAYAEDEKFNAFYYLDASQMKAAGQFIDKWASFLKDHKEEVLEGAYDTLYRKFVATRGISLDTADSYVGISKKIAENPYGDKGLAEWPEIVPSKIRDRIYLVLKKKSEPLHFATIAAMINTAGLQEKPALVPTVHNELIKDERFVLVGRGIYGLAEHGFAPGTAREVIHQVLRKHGPLTAQQVVDKVQEERFLKPNTIMVNLQNKSHFERRGDGTYKIREA
jgi:predicted Zn-ribbon and HTH transcriptional regulator